MAQSFSYRHLYYFWVVARRAASAGAPSVWGLSVQTVSAQVRELEQSVGVALLKPAGRGLALTEARPRRAGCGGPESFPLGEPARARLQEAVSAPSVRLTVGISDGLPKLVAHQLLAPVLETPTCACRPGEDEFDDLLGDLGAAPPGRGAGRPARATQPPSASVQPLARHSPVAWYASQRWADAAAADSPRSLAAMPCCCHRPCRAAPAPGRLAATRPARARGRRV